MPRYTRVLLHDQGPAMWPEQRSTEEVLTLKARTPPNVWAATYMLVPTSPSGTVFQRAWWNGKNRYDATDQALKRRALRRWISIDTAGASARNRNGERQRTSPEEAFTAMAVIELQPDYTVLLREVVRERIPFTGLVPAITALATRWYTIDAGKTLAAVIVEAESTGGPAIQIMQATAEPWLAEMLWGFTPTESKEDRARLITPWCIQDCIQLPHPSDAATWLFGFEEELFDFPSTQYKDQVDAFTQGIWAIQQYVYEGFVARQIATQREEEQARLLLAQGALG